MATRPFAGVLEHLRRLGGDAGPSDAQLLDAFRARRDEAAFEALVRRHGPMVFAVCRRLLPDPFDAEDAFQATFLVLVRRAGSLGRPERVGNWLYGVAHRTALRARARSASRRERERPFDEAAKPAIDEPLWQDVRRVLDDELMRLPDKYRLPVVLCYLEGQALRAVARQLGWPLGTVSSRLNRARELLRQRLVRRGVTLSAATLAALLAERATAAVPGALAAGTVRLAVLFAAETAAAGLIPARVAALTQGVLQAMFLTKLRVASVLALAVGLLVVGGGGALRHQVAADEPGQAEPARPPVAAARDPSRELRTLAGHTGVVTRVAFSPDGRRLASTGMDGTVRLWDVPTGKELIRITGHRERVDGVAFAPDGKIFASCAWDGIVRLWDAATGVELRRIAFAGEPGVHVENVLFFPDGKRLLVNAVDHHSLRIFDVATGKLVKEFAEHPDHVDAIALSPDGKVALEGNWDKHVRAWDVESGRKVWEVGGFEGHVYAVAIDPGYRLVAAGGLEGTAVHLLDVVTGREVRRLVGHTKHIDAVAFTPDGRRLLSCGGDQTVRLWDVATGKELERYFGHTDRVTCVAVSPDGKLAASGGSDKTIRFWQLGKADSAPPRADDRVDGRRARPQQEIETTRERERNLDQQQRASPSEQVRRFDGHTAAVLGVAFAPDGQRALSASSDGTVRLWDVLTGKELHRLGDHNDGARSVAFSPDGKRAVSTGDNSDCMVKLWDLASGRLMASFGPYPAAVHSVPFFPDGKRIVFGCSADKTLRLVDVQSGRELRRFAGHTDNVHGLALSPDGKTILSCSSDRTLRLWDVESGKELRRFRGHAGQVWGVAISPDGRLALSAGEDKTVRLWDLATGKEVRQLGRYEKETIGVAFSPDGRCALSGGYDNTLHLWDVTTGKELAAFRGHTDAVHDVAFSPDGKYALSGSLDKSVRLWRLPN